jgi:hypothetical protein
VLLESRIEHISNSRLIELADLVIVDACEHGSNPDGASPGAASRIDS